MSRIKKYYKLNTELSYLSDDQVSSFITSKEVKSLGITQVIKFKKNKIFLKVIPIAELFYKNQFNTSNLYDLPVYYNYGIGSAGVNPWRELLLHIKTSNWVLENKSPSFPLLYHYRIIENDNKSFSDGGVSNPDLMKRWGNNKQIKKYLTDRSKSNYKIVLFLEHIPHVAYKYLEKNPKFIKSFYDQSSKIVKLLKSQHILHNDGHLRNILVDNNKKIYLTDFGLSFDKAFDLSKDEIKFMDKNAKIDQYYMIRNIFQNYLYLVFFNKKVIKKYKLNDIDGSLNKFKYILDNINEIAKDVKMSTFQLNFLKKNKQTIIKFNEWLKKLIKAKNKSGMYVP